MSMMLTNKRQVNQLILQTDLFSLLVSVIYINENSFTFDRIWNFCFEKQTKFQYF